MSKNDETPQADSQDHDPMAFVENMAKAMEASAEIFKDLSEKATQAQSAGDNAGTVVDMQKTFFDLAQSYARHPEALLNHQIDFWKNQGELWTSAWLHALGKDGSKAASPKDRRFKDESWQENQIYDLLRRSYLNAAHWAQSLVDDADNLDEHEKLKARFYTQQVANALAPSNYVFSNPEVVKLTLETNGENLVKGMQQMAEDLKFGKIRQTDFSAFEVGRNMAMTPGKVVFRNDLIELIQYEPTTAKVYQEPLLIIPPWINKYYILDLNEKKSFVRWAVAQGLTVFVISWVNPDASLRDKTFEDYMREGVFAALDAVGQATGEKQVNAIGYCVGGTLLASSLAYMAAKGDKRISSATFFTTQVDFEEAGDLKVFVDEEQVSEIEEMMSEKGYLPGSVMSNAFNMLRSNDLIWSYVINKYLKGKEPMPFDLLCWNADSTNLTEANHSFYLRQCYLYNNLSQKRMKLGDEVLDLKNITLPVYNLATREDHIAPLASVFKLGGLFGGDTRLVVSGSGHIAGVVNPPEAGKYQYWLNDKGADTLDQWLKNASEHKGSWWPDWLKWISKKSGKKVAARVPGDGKLKPICDAPGTYVLVKGE